MLKYLTAILLMFTTTYASAELLGAKLVVVHKGDDATIYLDRASIKKDGNLRQVWLLADRYKPDEDRVISVRYLSEIDCKETRIRSLRYSAHGDHMRRGRLIGTSRMDGAWRSINTGSVAHVEMKIVCAE